MRICVTLLILLALLLAGGCDEDEDSPRAHVSDDGPPVVPVVSSLPLAVFGLATVLIGFRARRRRL